MAQKVVGYVRFQVPAGKATPAPPVGPALGQYGVNIGLFTKDFNERTKGLVTERELRLMKPSAVIVNMGRGGIIVEADLAKVIDEGLIHGAALDVYETEPLPAGSPLLHTSHPERLRFTPHTGWASAEALVRLEKGIERLPLRF